MNSRRFVFVLGLCLVAPSLAVGQTGGGSGGAPASGSRQMYEDVEVMRRLLLGKLQSQAISAGVMGQCAHCHVLPGTGLTPGSEGSSTGSGDGAHFSTSSLLAWLGVPGHDQFHFNLKDHAGALDGEGAYLKGRGVVFALTSPSWGQDPQAEAAKPAAKPLSDWDRVRQQLRGDRKEPNRPGPVTRPSPVDVVLTVLAENGKHLTALSDDESITVVLTFRDMQKPGAADGPVMGGAGPSGYPGSMGIPGPGVRPGGGGEGGGFGPPGGGPAPGGFGGPPGFGPGTPGSPEGGFSGPGASGGGGAIVNPSTARDYELLGDLHFRQGNMLQALEAFKEGVKRTSKAKELATLYQKMAAAQLATGQADTDAAVAKAVEYLKKVQDEKAKAATGAPETPTSELPAKLIVTAPKKLLDQVGSGKIGFEEFKKSAAVEQLNFSAPATKPSK